MKDIDEWMAVNKLKLNKSRTELIVIGSQHQPKTEIEVLAVGPPDDVYSSNAARNIGVIFDETSFLHIRQIARIRRFLTDESVETLVHAVITCRLVNFSNCSGVSMTTTRA